MISIPAFAYSPQEAWFWQPPGSNVQLPLQSPVGAWNLASFGGSRFSVPVFRGQNYTVPFKAGQSWRAKMPDSRTITLAMWVSGQGDQFSGVYPASDQRLAFNNNYRLLRQQFFSMSAAGSQQGQLQRNWYITQGGTSKLVTSTAMAELAGSMDLTMNGRTGAAFSVDFLLADPGFYGALQTVQCTGSATAVTGLGEMVAGLGYPSPVASFTVSISQACTVTNVTAGVSFTFSGLAAFPVLVDVLNETVTDAEGTNWVAGISHAGARPWMVVVPGGNTISVSAGTATMMWNDVYV